MERGGSCCLPPLLLKQSGQNSALSLQNFKGCKEIGVTYTGKEQHEGEGVSPMTFLLLNALKSGGQDSPLGCIAL